MEGRSPSGGDQAGRSRERWTERDREGEGLREMEREGQSQDAFRHVSAMHHERNVHVRGRDQDPGPRRRRESCSSNVREPSVLNKERPASDKKAAFEVWCRSWRLTCSTLE